MSNRTKEDILLLIQKHRETIRCFGVKRLGLFGSFLRRQQDGDSDVDILVEFEQGHKTFDNFVRLAFFLEELFERHVELVTAESLSPHIGSRILKEVEYVKVGS